MVQILFVVFFINTEKKDYILTSMYYNSTVFNSITKQYENDFLRSWIVAKILHIVETPGGLYEQYTRSKSRYRCR